MSSLLEYAHLVRFLRGGVARAERNVACMFAKKKMKGALALKSLSLLFRGNKFNFLNSANLC